MIGGHRWNGEAVAASEFDDPEFLARLRAGDSRAYDRLVRRYHGTLVGVATGVLGSRAQAEEVVQDTWLAVLGAIGRFEGRSSLITWLFSIVMNRARTRLAREGRMVALPAALEGARGEERAVPLSAFQPNGHWVDAPRLWDELDPERVYGGRQLWEHVLAGIETLPAGQKSVLVLRDMEGVSAEEACELLQITPENQRVLLHRARGRIRKLIDEVTAPPRRRGHGPAGVALLLLGVAQVLAHQAVALLARSWRSQASKARASVL